MSNKRLDVQDESSKLVIAATTPYVRASRKRRRGVGGLNRVLPGHAVLYFVDVFCEPKGKIHCPWNTVEGALTKQQWTDQALKHQIRRVSPSKDFITQSSDLTREPVRGRASSLDLLVARCRYCNSAGPEPTTTEADPGSECINAGYGTQPLELRHGIFYIVPSAVLSSGYALL